METVHWPHDIADRVRQLPAELALVPLVPAAAMGPTSTVIRLSDFHTTREWHAMPIYSELYRPTGIEYQIVVPVGFAAPSSGVRGKRAESFTLGRWDSDFTDRERAILDEFGRHVRSAARRLRMMPIDPSSELAARSRLTERQLESLLAVADGATVDAAARGLAGSIRASRRQQSHRGARAAAWQLIQSLRGGRNSALIPGDHSQPRPFGRPRQSP